MKSLPAFKSVEFTIENHLKFFFSREEDIKKESFGIHHTRCSLRELNSNAALLK